jgi:hypothetical protein
MPSAWPARVLAPVLAVLLSVAAGHAPKSPVQAGLIRGRWGLRNLERTLRAQAVAPVQAVGNGKVAQAEVARAAPSNLLLILRHPPDVEQAVRLHNAYFLLAQQLGHSQLVLPSAQIRLPSGEIVMATLHAPAEFRPANQQPARSWLDHIPDQTRMVGALLDFLTGQQDRISKNILVNSSGEVRLIDHDFSFGHDNPFGYKRSRFFYRGKTGYTGNPAAGLPPSALLLVQQLAAMPPETISGLYGLTPEEAVFLRGRAALVERFGLTGAITKLP